MGDLLLSILGFNQDGALIYTRRLKGSHYNVGDVVPLMCPHPNRKVKRNYYRILEKLYDPELIVKLLETKNPDVIDQNGFVPYQRRLVGKEMLTLVGQHHSFQQIAHRYGVNKHAVELAIKLYQAWQKEQDAKEAEQPVDDEPLPHVLTPAEKQAHIKEILDNWD